MSRLTKLAALLLLAFWLPATLHCQLEIAGFGEPHHDECCSEDTSATGADCRGDACANVETSLIKESAHTFDLAAPAGCACFLCLQLPPSAMVDESIFQPSDQPQDWITTWHFVRRDAPAPRAPSSLLA